MNWKRNVVLLAIGAAAFAGIRSLESLAETGTNSPIACYVGLADDMMSLINSADTAASSADCLAQIASVDRK
jgi:hypothetical protein